MDVRNRFARAVARSLIEAHGKARALDLMRRAVRSAANDDRVLREDVLKAVESLEELSHH